MFVKIYIKENGKLILDEIIAKDYISSISYRKDNGRYSIFSITKITYPADHIELVAERKDAEMFQSLLEELKTKEKKEHWIEAKSLEIKGLSLEDYKIDTSKIEPLERVIEGL